MMRMLGRIARLQVQRSSVKVGEAPRRRFDPEPLLEVSRILLGPDGVLAQTETGAQVIDIHNASHPDSKNSGFNDVSVGFVPHYDAMRARFGTHLWDGVAGENILIETGRSVTEADLRDGLLIEGADGQLRLDGFRIAEPCVEFTRYALRWPADAPSDRTVTEALQFLREGMRGFYATYEGSPLPIRAGDRVLLP